MADPNNEKYEGQGLRGPLWTGAGAMLANLLTNIHGGSGILGAQSSASDDKVCELRQQVAILTSEKDTDAKLVEVYKTLATYDKAQDAKVSELNSRVLALETAAPLKEQLVDQKIARVTDTMTCCCNATNASIAQLQAAIGSFSSLYVDAQKVTPLPMQRYNSFVVPTTPTGATSSVAGS